MVDYYLFSLIGVIMTQNHTKIQGKFYPLQHDEWLRACRDLTLYSQRDVLYYIRTLDPYNQGVEINAGEMARQLSLPRCFAHAKSALAQAATREFGITVTFEEVR